VYASRVHEASYIRDKGAGRGLRHPVGPCMSRARAVEGLRMCMCMCESRAFTWALWPKVVEGMHVSIVGEGEDTHVGREWHRVEPSVSS
jgi:hypothetical protein